MNHLPILEARTEPIVGRLGLAHHISRVAWTLPARRPGEVDILSPLQAFDYLGYSLQRFEAYLEETAGQPVTAPSGYVPPSRRPHPMMVTLPARS